MFQPANLAGAELAAGPGWTSATAWKAPLSQVLSNVRQTERQTGLDFYPELPKEVQERLETGKAERLW